MKRLAAPLVAFVFAVATPIARADDPALRWRSIDTPHFVVTYHSGEERLARRLALLAEEAQKRVSAVLDHTPRFKTELVIADQTDDVNGFTNVYPYRQIHLYAAAPDDRSELNDYDDWMLELITHEYTHIVHLDTIHGIARVINWILGFGERGILYSPNNAQPRFIIEGLAVFEETERTSAGRLRSTIWDMWLRTAMLENKFERLDQFSVAPIQFPRAESVYVYGAYFLRYVVSLFGQDVLRKLSHEYGGSWIPGGFNRALRTVTGGRKGGGKTFADLYPGFHRSMRERYQRQLAAIEAAGRVEGTPLIPPHESVARPVFTPDGQSVVWADSDGYVRPRLNRISINGGKTKPELLVDGAGGSTFTKDGRTLYFNAFQVWRQVYFYNDLFKLDVATKEKVQITSGLRAESPDLSPDGTTLAFNVNSASSRSLAIMPANGGPVTLLLDNRDSFEQVYTPSWSPDGKRIAFSWWREGGYRDIWIIDVKTRALTRVTSDRALDLDPRWSPDGRYLYFSSDRTGIYNLYAWEEATNKVWQVTNVIGGAFDVAISPDGKRAVYVDGVADGWVLCRLDLDPARFRPAPEPLLDRPDADVPSGLSNLPSRRYNAARSLWPHLWSLSLYPDSYGQAFSINLNGQDAVGHHAFSAALGFSLARADAISFSGSYVYSGLYPELSVAFSRSLSRRGGFYIDAINHAYNEDDYSLSASIDLPFLRLIDRSSDLSFGYNFAYLRNADGVHLPLDPSLSAPILPETGRVASFGATWSYSNVRRFTFSVSPELGRDIAVSVGVSLKQIGSQFNVVTTSWHWTEFLPSFWRNHTLILSYSGGISGGDITHRGVFFLGGYPPQPDVLRSAFDFTRPGGASLRGYPWASIYGDQFQVANAEYRFPITWIERGWETFPFYFRRLHGAVFADYGNAWNGTFHPSDLKLGVGAELRLEVYLFYDFPAALQLGYAHGFMTGGLDQVYFYLNNPF